MRARHAPAILLALAAAGCGETLVDHGAPADLIGPPGGSCDPSACPPPDPSWTGARAACFGSICGYECTNGLLKCTEGCCSAASVAAGGAHTCAITGSPAPGSLYCWGSNEHGQVSTVPSAPLLTPQKVFGGGVTSIALGVSHTCAIVNGSVSCWGRNTEGQAPAAVSLTSPNALAAGAAHTCARDGNAVRCWGGGAPGVATVIASGADSISAGADHTCTRLGSEVRCWGAGALGQLGIPSPPASTPDPVAVTLLGSGGAGAVAAGSNLSCAAANSPSGGQLDDALQCWGSGLGVLPAGPDPQLIPEIPRRDPQTALIRFQVDQLSVGRAHVCVKRAGATNSVKCIGSDNWGQLGALPFVPPEAIDVPGSLGALAFAAGADHTCAVFATGGVFCWGRNDSGQLGDGTQITPFFGDAGARPIGTVVPVLGR